MRWYRAIWLATSVALLAAAPKHIQTADYFAGYAGTRAVDAHAAAKWLSWAETDIPGSLALASAGVRSLLYTDPNRQIDGEPLFTHDESTFAHDCGGARIPTSHAGQFLMDPASASLAALWRRHVARYASAGRFDAILEDDADDVAYARTKPCRYSDASWLSATIALQRSLGYPIVYNGLSNLAGDGVSAAIGLNASAIGGMMEDCYAGSPADPPASRSLWRTQENTELQMAQAGKLFFCYGNDTTQADRALAARTFAYASFLLSYDPGLSILWEYFSTPSRAHVMPESALVALQPLLPHVTSIDRLASSTGVYERVYGACYLAGRSQGACVVAVNPDAIAHPLPLSGYRRTLLLQGSGIFDAGSASVAAPGPPPELGPHSAAIAFR